MDGGALVVVPALCHLVRFARHNLVRDVAPPAGEAPFDLVVCRNVLIYFDLATAEHVAGSLAGALRAGGTLLLGAADQLGRALRPARDHATESSRAGTGLRARPQNLLAHAVAAADAGNTEEALARVAQLLPHDPLNAGGHFLHGLVELHRDPRAAVDALRRALLIDPQPHIIMVTAEGRDDDRDHAVAAGVDDFLTKPFSPSQLLERVRAALAG